MQRRASLGAWLTLAASALGLLLAVYLTWVHLHVKLHASAGGLCNLGPGWSCEAVASSAFSELLGVPLALVGGGFFLAALVLTVAGLRSPVPRDEPTSLPGALVTLFAGATLASCALFGLSKLAIGSLCPGCVAVYVTSALGLAGSWLWHGRGPHLTLAGQARQLGVVTRRPAVLTGGLLFVATLGIGTPALHRYVRAHATPARLTPVSAAAALAQAPDPPALGPKGAPLVLVVFSDFQCPYCARFAVILHHAKETFGDELRIEFRNFPLPFHDVAPLAARAVVCAQEVGKFWELHDHLFGFQHRLSKDELPVLASEVGLDPIALIDCMKRPEVEQRVQADVAAGEQLGLEGTPSFVLNGQLHNGALPYDALERELRAALTSREPVARP